MQKYVTISRCEDEPYFRILTRKEIEENLKEEWAEYEFLSDVPSNLYEFPINSVFISKLEIVIPQPKEVVKEWQV